MRHQTIQNWINTEVKYRNVKLVKKIHALVNNYCLTQVSEKNKQKK